MPRKIILPLFITLILMGLIYSLSLIKVQSTECLLLGNEECPPALSDALSNKAADKPMFFYNFASALQDDQLAQLPYTLKSYKKKLPGTLVATFENEPAFYILKTTNAEGRAIGTKGTVIKSATLPEDLPVVSMEMNGNEIFDSEILPQKFHQPLNNLINSLYKNELVFHNVIWKSSDEIRLELENGVQVVLNSDNPSLAVKKLKLVLNSSELDSLNDQLAEIDLRFNMPVLRTN